MKCLWHLNSEICGTESSLQLMGALVFILWVGEALLSSAETLLLCALQRSGEIWILWQWADKLFHMTIMIKHTALIATACYEELVNKWLHSMDHDSHPMCC